MRHRLSLRTLQLNQKLRLVCMNRHNEPRQQAKLSGQQAMSLSGRRLRWHAHEVAGTGHRACRQYITVLAHTSADIVSMICQGMRTRPTLSTAGAPHRSFHLTRTQRGATLSRQHFHV